MRQLRLRACLDKQRLCRLPSTTEWFLFSSVHGLLVAVLPADDHEHTRPHPKSRSHPSDVIVMLHELARQSVHLLALPDELLLSLQVSECIAYMHSGLSLAITLV